MALNARIWVALIVVMSFLLIGITAWTDTGHVLTCEIARRQLSSEHVSNLDKLTESFSPYFKGRDVTRLPYSGTFMDDIKADTHLFDAMHFIDFPYQTGGDFEAPSPDPINGLNALADASGALLFNGAGDKRLWSKAFLLLLTVHVIGDIHQPLHAVSLFSDEFQPPLGDMGANLWRITYTSESGQDYTQMHLLFDCVGGLWCDYMPHPVTTDYENRIKELADSIMDEYPESSFTAEELDTSFTNQEEYLHTVTSWARESFELAKVAYQTYGLDEVIDASSISWARSMLKRRVALGGYRMGRVLARVNTAYTGEPEQTYWKPLAVAAIILTVVALVGTIVMARKYRDQKKLTHFSLNGTVNQQMGYSTLDE